MKHACSGELVIAARHSVARQAMVFVDAVSGADKPLEVDWRAATPLDVQRTRTRPCGYLVAGDQAETLERLRLLGVRLQPVVQAARWDVERYDIVGEGGGQRQDARGAIDDGGDAQIRVLSVKPLRERPVVPPGHVYVGLDQPLGALYSPPASPPRWVSSAVLSSRRAPNATCRHPSARVGPTR